LAGVAWLFVAVGFSTARLTRWLGGYGVYSYGVYLVHVAVVLGIEAFLVRDRSAVSLATLVMLTLGSFVMSTFISIALSRSKYTRFLVP
jgi:surface polysaccharide O-acyltransferase-like enzyme